MRKLVASAPKSRLEQCGYDAKHSARGRLLTGWRPLTWTLLAATIALCGLLIAECRTVSGAESDLKAQKLGSARVAAKVVRFVVNEKYERAPKFHCEEIAGCVGTLLKTAGLEMAGPDKSASDAVLTIRVEGLIPATPDDVPDNERRIRVRIVVNLSSEASVYEGRVRTSSSRVGPSFDDGYKRALASSPLCLEAANAIAKLKGSSAIQLLCTALGDRSASASTRAWSAQAIGELAAKEALSSLINATKDESAQVRNRAVWALGRIGDSLAADILTALLRDRDSEVRADAVWALGRIHEPKTLTALVQALDDQNREVRLSCVQALGEFGKAAHAPLIRATKDADANVREQAINELGSAKDPAAVPVLSAALEDANTDVREAALHALEEIGDESALNALIAALGNRRMDVWQIASICLARFGQRAVQPLVAALANPSARVREHAVGVLREIGDKAVVPQLMRLEKEDPDEDVRFWAEMALKKIGARESAPLK